MDDPRRTPILRVVKHGAFAKTAILPGEDPKEFEKLHSALIEEWSPVGPTEEDAVLDIAKGMWRKRRLQKFIHAEIEICRSDREHPSYDEAEGLRTLLNIIEDAPPSDLSEEEADSIKQFISRAVESNTPSYIATMLEGWRSGKEFESLSAWLAKLRSYIRFLLRAVEGRGKDPDLLLHLSAKVHTPDAVNHELAVDERIDAMIDRAVKCLVQAKAMKQMLASTSPRGGDDQPPKKIQTANLRDKEEHSTIKTARADSAREHVRGKRSRMAAAASAAPKVVRRRPGNAAAGR
jgi:hypothetical protein